MPILSSCNDHLNQRVVMQLVTPKLVAMAVKMAATV